jgi:hypothetical protein
MRPRVVLLSLLLAASASAQAADSAHTLPLVQDNSFLMEEAYNQEAGIVQHIMTFQRERGSNDFGLAFTQEWPVGSIKHQLSYDVPFMRAGGSRGLGDLGINYRYQLEGDGNAQTAISPRLSLTLPTGDWKRGRGAGAVGIEAAIPVSYVITPEIVTHANAGVGIVPSARNHLGDRATTFGWSYAQSLIYTASRVIQPMVEAVYSRNEAVVGEDETEWIEDFVVSPGVRAAMNFSSGLQIVPGIAFPIGVGPSSGTRGVFLYLSFEHPFTH